MELKRRVTDPAQGLKSRLSWRSCLLLAMFVSGSVFRPYICEINHLIHASPCFLLLPLLLALHPQHAPQLRPLCFWTCFWRFCSCCSSSSPTLFIRPHGTGRLGFLFMNEPRSSATAQRLAFTCSSTPVCFPPTLRNHAD